MKRKRKLSKCHQRLGSYKPVSYVEFSCLNKTVDVFMALIFIFWQLGNEMTSESFEKWKNKTKTKHLTRWYLQEHRCEFM